MIIIDNQQDKKTPSDFIQDVAVRMQSAHKGSPLSVTVPALVAVGKGRGVETLKPFLAAGLRAFGENRMQEAAGKWPELRREFPDVSLHFIGRLQSNKAAEAVARFDVIETVDREKVALALSDAMRTQGRYPRCLVQVNIGKEPQKAGVDPEKLGDFLEFCTAETVLPIGGLMCVPPVGVPPAPHFALMYELAKRHGLPRLSMGMSADFETAIKFGATHVRIGTALFGKEAAVSFR